MEGYGSNREKIIAYIKSRHCVVYEEPNGYRVEYRGKSNIEWQMVLLYMSSLDNCSISIISSTSACLFRI
ncbi:hypothetical protein TZ01_04525 [Acidiplasma sp. MBA-1]|nr:hypothetical protein TZ01_04525 [Acidiplasma sp. MBA-1]